MSVRDYELLYVLSPEMIDARLQPAMEKVAGLATRLGAEIKETHQTAPWGKRRLAYPIGKFQDGFYVLLNISLDPTKAEELERDLRFNEDVLRHMLVLPEKE